MKKFKWKSRRNENDSQLWVLKTDLLMRIKERKLKIKKNFRERICEEINIEHTGTRVAWELVETFEA